MVISKMDKRENNCYKILNIKEMHDTVKAHGENTAKTHAENKAKIHAEHTIEGLVHFEMPSHTDIDYCYIVTMASSLSLAYHLHETCLQGKPRTFFKCPQTVISITC